WGTLRTGVSSHGSPTGRIAYSFAASRVTTDGPKLATPAGPLEHDGYQDRTVSLGVRARIGEATTIDLDGRFSDAKKDLPIKAFSGQTFDVNQTESDRLGVFSARLAGRIGKRLDPFL